MSTATICRRFTVILVSVVCGCGTGGPTKPTSDDGEDAVFSSPLQRALKRGLAADGDLDEALRPLKDYRIRSRKDASAIVDALSRLPSDDINSSGYKSPLYALVGLFQDVDGRDAPAFGVLAEDGTKQLVRIFDQLKVEPTEETADDLLFLLKMLALYGTREGAEKIVEAARIPLKPDGYMWSVVLSAFSEGHPERDFVFRSLTDPLPPDFIGVSLLDSANRNALEGELAVHPFDTDQGRGQLRAWLISRNSEEYSYAHSATAALPFLHGPARDELLGLAREHTDEGVRIEAAWASAKLGQEIGLRMLAEYCRDPSHSATASRYLKELGKTDRIPEEARDADFQAKAEFANWLAHPNELGRPPNEVEVVDKRTLYWPPAGERTMLWLIKYVLRDEYGLEADDVDCGLVGSSTWCFFSYQMHRRPPEDCLAIHCCWELGLEDSVVDDATEYVAMLENWPHKPVSDPVVTRVVEIPPELKYGSRLVALAVGQMDGETGWAILDGEHGAWYPESEMPEGQYEGVLLKIHVGRRLLGFEQKPNRRQYLRNAASQPPPEQVIDAYEKLLRECETATTDRRKALVADWRSPLGKHLKRYATSCEQAGLERRSTAFARVFADLLAIVKSLPADDAEDAYGLSGPISGNFEEYVDILVEAGRGEEVLPMIEQLEPHWDHNTGYGQLGEAAYKVGDLATAERFLTKLKAAYPDWRRSERMSLLARLWHEHGKADQARDLLLDCLTGLTQEAKEATGSDRELFEEWYQNHRTTFLHLFSGGNESLKGAGLPETTLR